MKCVVFIMLFDNTMSYNIKYQDIGVDDDLTNNIETSQKMTDNNLVIDIRNQDVYTIKNDSNQTKLSPNKDSSSS